MGKIELFGEGRDAGLALALKIVKKGGIEALEKEIKFRNITKINTQYTQKELESASEKIKEQTYNTITLLAISVLHDRFGFGSKRVKEFRKWFDDRADCIMENMATWDDWQKTIKKELGIDIPIHKNDGTPAERRKFERRYNTGNRKRDH